MYFDVFWHSEGYDLYHAKRLAEEFSLDSLVRLYNDSRANLIDRIARNAHTATTRSHVRQYFYAIRYAKGK